MKRYFIYILASQRNGTLYIGATSNLINRIFQHKEEQESLIEMAQPERQLKNWRRQWKITLIEKFNPAWHDLYLEITHS